MGTRAGAAKPRRSQTNKEKAMAGVSWILITVIGVGILALALLWAILRNKERGDAGIERTESATRRLYREEDAARDPENDRVP
jgi:hypothetical protein